MLGAVVSGLADLTSGAFGYQNNATTNAGLAANAMYNVATCGGGGGSSGGGGGSNGRGSGTGGSVFPPNIAGGTENYQYVSTHSGKQVAIPQGWTSRVADNGQGMVYQKPGSTGNANMIRVMEPTTLYPQGYVRYYNQHGQPLDINGKPGDRAATHIALDYNGPIPGWPR